MEGAIYRLSPILSSWLGATTSLRGLDLEPGFPTMCTGDGMTSLCALVLSMFCRFTLSNSKKSDSFTKTP